MRICLRQGIGLTVCPEVSIQRELEDGGLVKLNWDEATMETSLLMIWHAEKWCSPLLRHFMAIATEVIAAYCPEA